MLEAVPALLGEAFSGVRHPSAMCWMHTEGSMLVHGPIEPRDALFTQGWVPCAHHIVTICLDSRALRSTSHSDIALSAPAICAGGRTWSPGV